LSPEHKPSLESPSIAGVVVEIISGAAGTLLVSTGLLAGAMRGLPFDRKVEALLLNRSDVALIVRPMLVAWRQLREQIAVFDKAIRVLVRSNSACRLLMSVPGIGGLSALAYVHS